MKKYLFLIILGVISVTNYANAQSILFTADGSTASTNWGNSTYIGYANQVSTTVTSTITKISVERLDLYSTNVTWNLTIWENGNYPGDYPTGNIIATSSVSTGIGSGWLDFNIASTTLSPGNSYWITIESSDTTRKQNMYRLSGSTTYGNITAIGWFYNSLSGGWSLYGSSPYNTFSMILYGEINEDIAWNTPYFSTSTVFIPMNDFTFNLSNLETGTTTEYRIKATYWKSTSTYPYTYSPTTIHGSWFYPSTSSTLTNILLEEALITPNATTTWFAKAELYSRTDKTYGALIDSTGEIYFTITNTSTVGYMALAGINASSNNPTSTAGRFENMWRAYKSVFPFNIIYGVMEENDTILFTEKGSANDLSFTFNIAGQTSSIKVAGNDYLINIFGLELTNLYFNIVLFVFGLALYSWILKWIFNL